MGIKQGRYSLLTPRSLDPKLCHTRAPRDQEDSPRTENRLDKRQKKRVGVQCKLGGPKEAGSIESSPEGEMGTSRREI